MLESEKKETWEWIKSILVAIVLALVIRAFLVEVFLVQGESMLPTLEDRQRLIVSKVQYYYREPVLGEVVVFEATDERDFIKRVIGVAGDEVWIDHDGNVYINDEMIPEPYVLENARNPFGPVVVPEETIFVLGDNRNNSMDSRHHSVEFVSLEKLKGKAMLVFWPLNEIHLISHP